VKLPKEDRGGSICGTAVSRRDRENEASKLKNIEEPASEANPFTIEEMALLLTLANAESLPFLVLGALPAFGQPNKSVSIGKSTSGGKPVTSILRERHKKEVSSARPILPVISDQDSLESLGYMIG
jgi:hypothetical protein